LNDDYNDINLYGVCECRQDHSWNKFSGGGGVKTKLSYVFEYLVKKINKGIKKKCFHNIMLDNNISVRYWRSTAIGHKLLSD